VNDKDANRMLIRLRLGLLGFLLFLIGALVCLRVWEVAVFGVAVFVLLVYFFPGDSPEDL
jgi:hypothetical protein